MKFPTIKEMAQNVAEKALDEYEYKGKTLRQWIEIIYNSEHGTNLAEVGTDCISRQAAITQLSHNKNKGDDEWELAVENDIQTIWKLPSAHPEIIRCRECKFASGDSRICMKFDHSPIGELDFCSFAERKEVTE